MNRKEKLSAFALVLTTLVIIGVIAVPYVIRNVKREAEFQKYASDPDYVEFRCTECRLPFYINRHAVPSNVELEHTCSRCNAVTIYTINTEAEGNDHERTTVDNE